VRELWGLVVPSSAPRGTVDESSLETNRQLASLHASRAARALQDEGPDAA
jgi:hypothetical protein